MCSNIILQSEKRLFSFLAKAAAAYCVMDESKVMEREKVPLAKFFALCSEAYSDIV